MLLHLHSNGLLPEHQSAYRRSHSTETALLKVTSDALITADMGELTLLGMQVLSIPYVRTSLGKRAFSVIAPRLWNSLPPDTRNSLLSAALRSNAADYVLRRFIIGSLA